LWRVNVKEKLLRTSAKNRWQRTGALSLAQNRAGKPLFERTLRRDRSYGDVVWPEFEYPVRQK
jgi:hypothetical protein